MTRFSLTSKIFSLVIGLSVSGYALADTIKIASDPWMPHTGHKEDRNGYILDIATAIFKEAGHQVEYVVMPWSRAISETREGNINAIAACFQEEAEDFIYPELAVGLSRSVLWETNGLDWEYTGPDSFNSITLAVVQDYSYGEEIDGYLAENKRNRDKVNFFFGDDPQTRMVEMLKRGRIDVMVEDQLVIEYLLKKMDFRADSITLSTDMGADELWLGFSPAIDKSAEYAQILTDGIKRFKENGKFDAILADYGLSPF
jgi:polar amino acid transport system substrate-binding protein